MISLQTPVSLLGQDERALSTAQTPLGNPDNDAQGAVDVAIERGLDYLISQQRDDGSITENSYDTTMTSLAIMALASTGTTPSSPGERGEAARKGLDFVLRPDRQDESGYFGNADGSRMYGHGITTLMLTEMLGMGFDSRQDTLIKSAVSSQSIYCLPDKRQKNWPSIALVALYPGR